MPKFFKPQFSLQYMNGVFLLGMNPQMAKELMDEIKRQGETLNMTLVAQVPFKATEAMRDLCNRSDSFFLRSLGQQLDENLEELREKRLAYENRRSNDDLEEEPLDDDPPSYGRRKQ